jgi:hypothetical protein
VEQTADPVSAETTPSAATAPRSGKLASISPIQAPIATGLRVVAQVIAGAALTVGLLLALVVGGLVVAPAIGVAADTAAPPRRPPIVPPSVPEGAREDWAVWSYVEKINQAWGKDWPLVIEWMEELDARYPGNPMVFDKLYAAYIEDGRTLQANGDYLAARRRYEQAARYDPDRGVAQDFLADLDTLQGPRR